MEIPKTMTTLALEKYGTPETYELATLETPKITKPDEILIKVYYAAVNPGEVCSMVRISSRIRHPNPSTRFPYRLGYDCSGIIAAIGTSVTKFKIGDEIWAKTPERGTIAQYHIGTESTTCLKPPSISWPEAAAAPLASTTALQAFRSTLKTLGWKDFSGKTVFIPAALSGTGLFAIQLAKNVFNAGKVITTASTSKIPRIPELLGPGVVDQIIDYTKSDPVKVIGRGQVDYFFDTIGAAVTYAPVMRKGGAIQSISMAPSGRVVKDNLISDLPCYVMYPMDVMFWWTQRKIAKFGASYECFMLGMKAEALEEVGGYVVEGKVSIVVGREAKFDDIRGIRAGCQEIFDAKGGVGKFVIQIKDL